MAMAARRPGKAVSLAYRAELAVRAVAGVMGGYVLTALITMLIARLLPLSPLEATEAATLLSFLVYLALLMAAFAIHRLWVMLAGGVGLAVLAGLGAWAAGAPLLA